MRSWPPLLFPFLLSPLSFASSTPVPKSASTYDYIVVGSGPGGGTVSVNLARAGYSVLLLEAGTDETADLVTQIHALGNLGASPNLGCIG